MTAIDVVAQRNAKLREVIVDAIARLRKAAANADEMAYHESARILWKEASTLEEALRNAW